MPPSSSCLHPTPGTSLPPSGKEETNPFNSWHKHALGTSRGFGNPNLCSGGSNLKTVGPLQPGAILGGLLNRLLSYQAAIDLAAQAES